MANQEVTETKDVRKKDLFFACSMLAIYAVCCLLVVAGSTTWIKKDQEIASANATITGVAVVTQQVSITATVAAHNTELAQYELIDRFDSNKNHWKTGQMMGITWEGNLHIESGLFIWDIEKIHDSHPTIDSDFKLVNDSAKNYAAYVDTKLSKVPSGEACSGLAFRKVDWGSGVYTFMICNKGYFEVFFKNIDGWQKITSQYHPAIQTSDWNRLEVLVNDSHFVFLINSQVVYETDDNHQSLGGIALVAIVEKEGTQILFDNLGFQSR